MNHDRFRARALELKACAKLLGDLTQVPERATAKDFRQVADLMTGAASDLDDLVRATPPGCICRRVQTDNYDYLDYAEACLHHRQFHALREKLKANYEKMERALKNEARMKIVVAALAGTAVTLDPRDGTNVGAWSAITRATPGTDVGTVVSRAIAIADEAIRRMTEGEP